MTTLLVPVEVAPAVLYAEPSSVEARLAALERELATARRELVEAQRDGVSLICMSGDFEKLYAAFTVATGALAMGQRVDMFFTFWGASAVLGDRPELRTGGSWPQRLMRWLQPRGAGGAPLSRMSFMGLGKWMLQRLMKQYRIDDLPTLIEQARDLGAEFHYCDTSMRLFGWEGRAASSLGLKWCGVATFLGIARRSGTTLVF